ncbi:unnamed protein product [Staurois parvus]|uniref:Uncharacterized protein n=1 Tax=Staurois parvus TaxID=386267 RepID=A0ABN9HSZ4_9NEOB|nr:unnamed protein product [Staurois parvus]
MSWRNGFYTKSTCPRRIGTK